MLREDCLCHAITRPSRAVCRFRSDAAWQFHALPQAIPSSRPETTTRISSGEEGGLTGSYAMMCF
eukprot:scaffold102676_cov31-Tisochrysis_lutea.AAC.5